MPYRIPKHVGISSTDPVAFHRVITPETLEFVVRLERAFRGRRRTLLNLRAERQQEINAGTMPDFLPATLNLRQAYWKVASTPRDLLDRRVEITGPTDRKMIINALNSGANVFMADFEDATSPTWLNIVQGQMNLIEAVERTIAYTSPEGKEYGLNEQVATLMVRPRGLHLDEKHIVVDGSPMSASLFDFGIFFFHNARTLLENGSGPYFYLPKLENHLEARWWNDVFLMAQDSMGIPRGSIRATVLIETILAAFEMHEILYELKDHSAGLNCGRWDYIFSVIKKFHRFPEFILPDRASVTMTSHFLHSYSLLLIQTCHRRGAHAIGGMAAQIPIKNDPRANEEALAKVRADKEREVSDGHDGTWVAHPGLVPLARSIFDGRMPGPNQLQRHRDDVLVSATDLLTIPKGEITEQGMRTNIRVAIQYLEAWLSGQGCVPLNNLMEDAATAEISRAQLWQWLHHPDIRLSNGRLINESLYHRLEREERETIDNSRGARQFPGGKTTLAAELLNRIVSETQFTEYLTTIAYHHLE
ncbi:MAG: malate synthase A [Woeseiaceae bacterium]